MNGYLRTVEVFINNVKQVTKCHQFGTQAVHGSDNEPVLVTVAIVETTDGAVHRIEPKKIKFLDEPT